MNIIGIVGAGPAGLMLAHLLSKTDVKVFLFDHKGIWEKPCGGGITSETFTDFPHIKELPIQFYTPARSTNLVTVNRYELGYAMYKSFFPSIKLIRQKVETIDIGTKEKVIINKELELDFIVGADGVNSIVRKSVFKPFTKEEKMLTFSTLINDMPQVPLEFTLSQHGNGYLWLFPRHDSTSIGIGLRNSSSKRTIGMLKEFINGVYSRLHLPVPRYKIKGHYIPSLSYDRMREQNVVGRNWALIGDASGLVDPETGEGISYAFKTAKLLAKDLLLDPTKYQQSWLKLANNFMPA